MEDDIWGGRALADNMRRIDRAWQKACRNGIVPAEFMFDEIYHEGFASGVMVFCNFAERVGKQWRRMLRKQYKGVPARHIPTLVAETLWSEHGMSPHYDPSPLYKDGFMVGVHGAFGQYRKGHSSIWFLVIMGLVNGFLHEFLGLGLLFSALITCAIFFIPAMMVAPRGQKHEIFWVGVFCYLFLTIGVEMLTFAAELLWYMVTHH